RWAKESTPLHTEAAERGKARRRPDDADTSCTAVEPDRTVAGRDRDHCGEMRNLLGQRRCVIGFKRNEMIELAGPAGIGRQLVGRDDDEPAAHALESLPDLDEVRSCEETGAKNSRRPQAAHRKR